MTKLFGTIYHGTRYLPEQTTEIMQKLLIKMNSSAKFEDRLGQTQSFVITDLKTQRGGLEDNRVLLKPIYPPAVGKGHTVITLKRFFTKINLLVNVEDGTIPQFTKKPWQSWYTIRKQVKKLLTNLELNFDNPEKVTKTIKHLTLNHKTGIIRNDKCD